MNKMKWPDIVDGYIREGRTISGGCGPSSALKTINSSIQSFATDVKSEASTVFDASSSVFNKIMGGITGILAGGPSQYGFSAEEQSAKTAEAVNAGGAEARNLKGAAASAGAAIGGGNVATPSGLTSSAVMSAEQKAAADTAAAENQITQQGYETGRENFFQAENIAEKAPDVFNASTEANKNVTGAQEAAMQSQQSIDSSSNWWKTDLMKLGMAGASALTGGAAGIAKGALTSATSESSPGTDISSFGNATEQDE